MRRTDGFILRYIEGVPYLLPYGQRIAEHRRMVRLNDTSAFIWEMYPNVKDSEELLLRMEEHWDAKSAEEREHLKEDLCFTVNQFHSLGLLCDDASSSFTDECRFYRIAGANIAIHGMFAELHSMLSDYAIPHTSDIQMTVRLLSSTTLSTSPLGGERVIEDEELAIFRQGETDLIHFPTLNRIVEMRASQDGSQVEIYCLPAMPDKLSNDVFAALRLVFARLMQAQGKLLLHSASLLYQERAWLFAGSSGTGKSTHTNLWRSLFHTPVLNGDLNLISIKKEQAVIQGTPWCGTSQISNPSEYVIGGIVLLKRDCENYVEVIREPERITGVLQRIISPSYTKEALCDNLDIIEQAAKSVPIVRLHCTKEPQAAQCMKDYIDSHIL